MGVDGQILPKHHRLPGYPVLLLALMQTPWPLKEIVYWLQGAAFVAFMLAAWWWTRRRVGALPALLLLVIIAAPSYAARMATEMLPDSLYSMLFLPVFLGIGAWSVSRRSWWWLVAIGAALYVLTAIRPTTVGLAVMFALALAVSVALTRSGWPAVHRAGALFVLTAVVGLLVNATLDTGARDKSSEIVALKWSTILPPAHAEWSDDDRVVEHVKDHWERLTGEQIEDARFGQFRPTPNFNTAEARAVWLERVIARPDLVVLSILNDLRWNHYDLAMRFTPGVADWARVPLYGDAYPRVADTPEYALFRATGIRLPQSNGQEHLPFATRVLFAVLREIAVWGLLWIGVWRLMRIWPTLTLAWLLMGLGFCVALSATNTLDARYLLPLALPIALCQGVGVGWIVKAVTKRPGSTDPGLALRR